MLFVYLVVVSSVVASPLDRVEARKTDKIVREKQAESKAWRDKCHCAFNPCLLRSYPENCDSSCKKRVDRIINKRREYCRMNRGDIDGLNSLLGELKAEAKRERMLARQAEEKEKRRLAEEVRKRQQLNQKRRDAVKLEQEAREAVSREKNKKACEAALARVGGLLCGCEKYAESSVVAGATACIR